jgi:hypothetical protein
MISSTTSTTTVKSDRDILDDNRSHFSSNKNYDSEFSAENRVMRLSEAKAYKKSFSRQNTVNVDTRPSSSSSKRNNNKNEQDEDEKSLKINQKFNKFNFKSSSFNSSTTDLPNSSKSFDPHQQMDQNNNEFELKVDIDNRAVSNSTLNKKFELNQINEDDDINNTTTNNNNNNNNKIPKHYLKNKQNESLESIPIVVTSKTPHSHSSSSSSNFKDKILKSLRKYSKSRSPTDIRTNSINNDSRASSRGSTNNTTNNNNNDNDSSKIYKTNSLIINNSRRVIINVGGVRHEILWKTLERLPKSRLGKIRYAQNIEEISTLCDDYDPEDNEFFFDRHPRSFSTIINFYRTGKLHAIDDICVLSFLDDLNYWGVHEFYLEVCCQAKYHQKKDAVLEEIKKEEETLKERVVDDDFGRCCPKLRSHVWDLMEKPQTSRPARVN